MAQVWEQRWHPLRREWVVVAAHRQDRPWLGERAGGSGGPALPAFDPTCTFCPGNTRVSGLVNPRYRGVFVFDNDRPCAGPDAPRDLAPAPGIYENRPADGLARVVCFAERHDLTLAEFDTAAVDAVLRCWQEQYRELAARPGIRHVLIFENKGEVVGVSNPHPHGQIYATNFVFKTIETEAIACREHFAAHGRALWEDIVATEVRDGRRLLVDRDGAVAFVPWFARYAYEVHVGPRRAVPSIADLEPAERTALAAALREVLIRYDNLWRTSFPYVLALHNAPTDGADHRGFGFHVELHPPLRKPGLLKYLAGPEIGGGSFLADTAPEDKAAELRAAAAVHWQQVASDARDPPGPPGA
jgi:UDPglucose--hexose-1-phosphate uridylyltransferase